MRKVKAVTAFVPLGVKNLSQDQYHSLGQQLIEAVGQENILVFPDFPLEQCEYYAFVDLPHIDKRDYPDRYARKEDMSRSSVVQHNRPYWGMLASDARPEVDVWVWLDYGVMKQGDFTGNRVKAESIRAFMQRVAEGVEDDVPFPGIWPVRQVPDYDADWRFCGSTHIWPKKYIKDIHDTYRTELLTFITRTQCLPYDMTIWSAVERTGVVPFRQYLANHDDTQFTNYTPVHGRTPLCELAMKYGTDKCVPAKYTPVYHKLLQGRHVRSVLEIGICAQRDIPNHRTGASLWMWSDYFPDAKIVGIDIDPKSMVNDPDHRIYSYLCDQSDAAALREMVMWDSVRNIFDLIVDDGSHNPIHQLVSMQTLLPFLRRGGLYVIEDIGNWMFPSTRPEHLVAQVPGGFKADVYGELPHQLVVIQHE